MKDRNQPWTPQSNREQHYRTPAFEPPRGGESFDASQRHWRGGDDDWHGERAGGEAAQAGGQRGFQSDSDAPPVEPGYFAGRDRDDWREQRDAPGRAGGSGRWQSDYGPFAGREPYPPRDRGNRHPGTVGNWQEPVGARGGEGGGSGYGSRSRESLWQRGMSPRTGEFERGGDFGDYERDRFGSSYREEPRTSGYGRDGDTGGYAGNRAAGGGAYGGYGGVSRGMTGWQPGTPQRSIRGPKGYTRSDERIREDICERLMLESGIDVGEVSVDVEDGTVKLSGEVEQRWMKHRIEDIADACGGVKDVRNQIEVARVQSQSNGADPNGSGQTASGTDASRATASTLETSPGIGDGKR